MYTVKIPANKAYAAIQWASDRFADYEIQHMMPDLCYEFRFKNAEHASFFALKWK